MGEVLDLFPGELVPAEVAARGGVAVDGALQVEVLDDHARTQVEVARYDALQVVVRVA